MTIEVDATDRQPKSKKAKLIVKMKKSDEFDKRYAEFLEIQQENRRLNPDDHEDK